MSIDLLRHGETQSNGVYCGRTDVLLSTRGWSQLCAAVADQHWQEVVSSPLARCRAFAQHLAQSLHVPLRIDSRWQEMDFGAWENCSAQQLLESDAERYKKFCLDPVQHSPPDGETLLALQERVDCAWQEVANTQKSILVVTHGGPIRIIHCLHYNYPLKRLLDIPVAHASLHQFATTAVNSATSQCQH